MDGSHRGVPPGGLHDDGASGHAGTAAGRTGRETLGAVIFCLGIAGGVLTEAVRFAAMQWLMGDPGAHGPAGALIFPVISVVDITVTTLLLGVGAWLMGATGGARLRALGAVLVAFLVSLVGSIAVPFVLSAAAPSIGYDVYQLATQLIGGVVLAVVTCLMLSSWVLARDGRPGLLAVAAGLGTAVAVVTVGLGTATTMLEGAAAMASWFVSAVLRVALELASLALLAWLGRGARGPSSVASGRRVA